MKVLVGWGDDIASYPGLELTTLEELRVLLYGLSMISDLDSTRKIEISDMVGNNDEPMLCITIIDTKDKAE